MTQTTSSVENAAPIQVKRIDHVTLIVKDLDRSRDFYVGLLGMQEVQRPGFSFGGAWFQAGDTQIHLILEHDESSPAGLPEPDESAATTRTHHFAFEVDDAYAAADELKARGIRMHADPKLRPDGFVQTFCIDPDGHTVELFSTPQA